MTSFVWHNTRYFHLLIHLSWHLARLSQSHITYSTCQLGLLFVHDKNISQTENFPFVMWLFVCHTAFPLLSPLNFNSSWQDTFPKSDNFVFSSCSFPCRHITDVAHTNMVRTNIHLHLNNTGITTYVYDILCLVRKFASIIMHTDVERNFAKCISDNYNYIKHSICFLVV